MKKIQEKEDTVLLTGASSGIGKAMAYEYAKLGKNLVLIARNKEKLEKIAEDIKIRYSIKIWVFAQDLTAENAVNNIFDFTEKEKISVTYLINNAGFGLWGEYQDIPWEKEGNMLQLNILALSELTKKYITSMEKIRYGKIMNVASTSALNPVPFMAAYGASKAYVLSFSEALAAEYKKKGIKVMCLCPGYTTTGFQDVASVHKSKYMDSFKPVTAAEVAKYAVKRLERGKVVSIHQFSDRILDFFMRFIPRKIIRSTARNMLKSKQQ